MSLMSFEDILSEKWCLVSLSRQSLPFLSIQFQVSERLSSLHVESDALSRSLYVRVCARSLMWRRPSCGMWNDQDELGCDVNKLFCFYLSCSIFLSFDFLWQKMVLLLREAGDDGFFFFLNHRKEVKWRFLCECWKNSSRYWSDIL